MTHEQFRELKRKLYGDEPLMVAAAFSAVPKDVREGMSEGELNAVVAGVMLGWYDEKK